MPRHIVAILFGGKSVEHEISIVTAREVLGAIDRVQYSPLPIYVNREGRWFCGDRLNEVMNNDRRDAFASDSVGASLEAYLEEVVLLPVPGIGGLVKLGAIRKRRPFSRLLAATRPEDFLIPVHVFMPLFHGTFGEDGCMQGLFELAEVAYTGCNTVVSALGMHKHFAKQLLTANGIESLPGILVRKREMNDFDSLWNRINGNVSFPSFVKPCSLGSSVGISNQSVVYTEQTLAQALAHVFRYDESAIIEPYLTDLRELQVAVCRGKTIHVSAVEAPKVHGINTAASKYGSDMLTSGSKRSTSVGLSTADRELDPVNLPDGTLQRVVAAARSVYDILGCSGVVRVDFFYDKAKARLLFNEINTLPGSLSLFLFHGLKPCLLFTQLLNTLIESAEELYATRDNYKRTHVF
jgi:D-alanine-D-alanine ligase